MPAEAITNIKAVRVSDRETVLTGDLGEYQFLANVNHISVFPPCETDNGGPSQAEYYNVTYLEDGQPGKIEQMKYVGQGAQGAYRFAQP